LVIFSFQRFMRSLAVLNANMLSFFGFQVVR